MSGYGAVEELMLSMEGLRGDGGEGRGAGGAGGWRESKPLRGLLLKTLSKKIDF